MKQFLITICLSLLPFVLIAQKDQCNWYFGRYAAISFESGNGQPKYDNPKIIYGPSASVSHPITGNLLFYTDGQTIWNFKHEQITNGTIPNSSPLSQIIPIPVPGKSLVYYIFTVTSGKILQYTVVDMNQNNGDGAVTRATSDISYTNGYKIAAIKHRYAQAYWLITHDVNKKNDFKAHYVDSNGVKTNPVISSVGKYADAVFGDMVASNEGNKLVVTHYSNNNGAVEIFDFDPICGKVSNPVELNKIPLWDYSYGAAFSPDDSKLYITFGYQLSQLVQYYGPNYQNNYFIASSPENFNVLRAGPDGRIYMTTHDNSVPGERINVILKPNEISGLCDFRETFFRLDEGSGKRRTSLFELPKFASGKNINNPVKDSLITIHGNCLGDTSFFSFNTTNPFDSIRWFFGENNQTDNRTQTAYIYRKSGQYVIQLHVYRCGNTYPFSDTLIIDSIPTHFLPHDTVICAGASLLLSAPKADTYRWSTGATTNSIYQNKTGNTWLTITKGKCKQTDTITITNHPDPFITLADIYHICEDDNELVKLDAGEGFVNYKWTPTEDTTQWIIVKTIGEYFVKVIDYNGCPGNDQSKVKRRCGVLVHFPNAFSPNNDGINDRYSPVGRDVESFEINIYNRWGQLVFQSSQLNETWDGYHNGKPAPADAYVFLATYTGYNKKQLVTITQKGQLTLLR